jgi:hypothetical protein
MPGAAVVHLALAMQRLGSIVTRRPRFGSRDRSTLVSYRRLGP